MATELRTPIAIRHATPDDAIAIAEVHVASWRTTYPGIVEQSYIDGLSVVERADVWSRRLLLPDQTAADVLVATTTDGRVVGFACGGLIRDPYPEFDAELYAVYLLQSFQRAGLGRRLARHWATLALEHGLRAAVVRVLADNSACAFYERLGAQALRDNQLVIGGKSYDERWYGWRSLVDLTR
jgi:GNAT superfamily N-acetyltransferase